MGIMLLKKDGFYTSEYDDSLNGLSYSLMTGPICLYLQDVISIDKGVTMEGLMMALMSHEADIDSMFFGFSKGHRLRPFFDEMCLPPVKKMDKLSFVEVGWNADYFRSERRGQPNELCISLLIHGVTKGKNKIAEYHNMSQVPLNDWKHLPMTTCDLLRVTDMHLNTNMSGRNESTFVTLLQAKKEITLYDFIGGFIETITWYGYPSQRAEHLNDIEHTIAQEGESLENKMSELNDALSVEDYERAAILKAQIEELKKMSHEN